MNPAINAENLIGPDRVMDVREIPCSIKHGLILQTCVELPVGGYFILLNGRDPAHLREQLSAWWPDAFGWEYLARSADEVRVRISKLKKVMPNADSAAEHSCAH